MSEIMVRIPGELIEKLKEKFPEVKDEANAFVVRFALRRLLKEGE